MDYQKKWKKKRLPFWIGHSRWILNDSWSWGLVRGSRHLAPGRLFCSVGLTQLGSLSFCVAHTIGFPSRPYLFYHIHYLSIISSSWSKKKKNLFFRWINLNNCTLSKKQFLNNCTVCANHFIFNIPRREVIYSLKINLTKIFLKNYT